MREILFRGKRVDNGEWVYWTAYGKFTTTQYGKLINQGKGFTDWAYEILTDPDTEGQYTGLTDKNGKRIFEGDFLRHHNDCPDSEIKEIGVVFWDGKSCGWRRTSNGEFHHGLIDTYRLSPDCVYEIIGNIHDNPELLED